MKILNLSTYDTEGGGGKAATTLHQAFLRAGCKSRMLVLKSGLRSDLVGTPLSYHFARLWHACLRRIVAGQKGSPLDFRDFYKPGWTSPGVRGHPWISEADVLVLYWTWNGLLSPSSVGWLSRRPLVWRLSDCLPFTGGCTFPGDCNQFTEECRQCPILRTGEGSIVRGYFELRRRAYDEASFTVVAPSNWIAAQARRSRLLGPKPIVVCHTGVNTRQFRPSDTIGHAQLRRLKFGFCAPNAEMNGRKGLDQALAIWRAVRMKYPMVDFDVAGADGGPDVGNGVNYLGNIRDKDALRAFYNQCDALIAPYRGDNLPNVVLEAMACGTFVLGSRVGGIPEAIEDGVSGRLFNPGDLNEAVAALSDVCETEPYIKKCRVEARIRCLNYFDVERQSQKFVAILAQEVERRRSG